MNINKKRTAIFATVAAVALSGTGVAYAYWTSTGTGAGSATAGTAAVWTITNQATTGGALTPGGPTQTATFNVNNGGTGVQRLAQVQVSIKNSNGTAWAPVGGCTAADFELNLAGAGNPVVLTVGANVAAGADSAQQSVDIKMLNTSSNQDGCKNVTVPLYYEAS